VRSRVLVYSAKKVRYWEPCSATSFELQPRGAIKHQHSWLHGHAAALAWTDMQVDLTCDFTASAFWSNHGQMVKSWSNHGQRKMCADHGLTMV
jgi:hypothetical protein